MPDTVNQIVDNIQVRGSISGGGVQALARTPVVSTIAGSGSNGITVLDDEDIDVGVGDFTVHWEGSLQDWSPSFVQYLYLKDGTTVGVRLSIRTTQVIRMELIAAGLSLDSIAVSFPDGTNVKITVCVVRQSASTSGSATFYVNGAAFGSPVTIPAAAVVTESTSTPLYISGTASARIGAATRACYLFNRALSASEVASLCINGVPFSDVGASQTPVYTSDVSAGADSWSGTSLTVAGNVDGIGGRDNVLSITCTSTGASETPRATRTIFPATDINKPGEIKIALYRPSSNTTITGLRLNNSSGNGVFTNTSTVNTFNTAAADTWEVFTVSGTMLGLTTDLRFSPVNAAGVRTQVTGEVIYVVDVTGKRLGCTLQLDAENAQWDTGQIFDTSGNRNHAMLPAAGATVLPRKRRFEVRGTNTWAGTNELQYIGGVNQAILPANAYIESIVGTVSGATPHDIIIGDGSDTDRYVTITTGLAAGTTSFTLANRTTDGTNLKLTVDPDTDATMSIAWVITYYTLET